MTTYNWEINWIYVKLKGIQTKIKSLINIIFQLGGGLNVQFNSPQDELSKKIDKELEDEKKIKILKILLLGWFFLQFTDRCRENIVHYIMEWKKIRCGLQSSLNIYIYLVKFPQVIIVFSPMVMVHWLNFLS